MIRWGFVALFGFVVALGLSCAHMKDDKTVCEEYRNLRCLTKEECTMDPQRGCQICRCTPATPNDRPTTPDQPDDRAL